MRLEDRLEEYYQQEWAAERWQGVPGYAREDLAGLACDYEKFEGRGWSSAISEGLRDYSKMIIKPWIGSKYESNDFKTVVLLREYPLPTLIKKDAKRDDRLPESRGEKAISSDVMRHEIQKLRDTLRSSRESRYTTLMNACRWACDVEQSVRRKSKVKFGAEWIDGVVVTDLVKLFAIFVHEARKGDLSGEPFNPSQHKKLSRSSVHSRCMYRWALQRLKDELDLLTPSLVVSFVGPSGWRCADNPREHLNDIVSSYRTAFCDHPGAHSRKNRTSEIEAWSGIPSWRTKKGRAECYPRIAYPRCGA